MDEYEKPETLDEEEHSDVIKNIYIDIISDSDEIAQSEDISAMNEKLEDLGYGFLFVSKESIKASSFQSSKYKYGNYLYEVYGTGDEHILDDPNELYVEIVMTKKPLLFKEIDSPEK